MSWQSLAPPSQSGGNNQLEVSANGATRSVNPRQCSVLEGQAARCQKTFHRIHKPSKVPDRYQRAEVEGWLEEKTWLLSPSGDSTGTGGQAPQREDLDGLSHDRIWENTKDADVGSRSPRGCHIERQIRAPTVAEPKLCGELLDHHSK